MNVLVPVNSFASARFQIESGADEIYLGLSTPFLKRASFGGRGNITIGEKKILPDEDEFASILTLGHSRNVKVFLAANTQFLADDPKGRWNTFFLKHIKWAIEKGIDGIIIADIGAALLLRQHGIHVPFLIASNYFDPINTANLKLLSELGFNRAVLPAQLLQEEIVEFARAGVIDLEVFANSGCSLFDGACGFKLHGDWSSGEDLYNVGVPCRNEYKIIRDGALLESSVPLFDDKKYCSICSLSHFLEAGVAAIKIVGRAQEIESSLPFTKIYKKVVQCLKKGYEMDEIKKEVLPCWWKSIFCLRKSCKYVYDEDY